MMESKESFIIDFYELGFLAQACIPPKPIARSMFWLRLIDVIYYQLTENQRKSLYEWLLKSINDKFEDGKYHSDVNLFINRYNPNNQYIVKTNYNGKEEITECFYDDDKYKTKSNTYIAKEYIIDIKRKV